MILKRKLMTTFVAAALGAWGSAQAQVSDNVVKIGVLTDLSNIYSDVAGQGSVIAARMARAQAEISHWDGYDYVIVNDDIDECFAKVCQILAAERMRRARQTGLIPFVRGLTSGS